MDRRKKIEEEINKTLESFDQLKSIEGNPFFYIRLQAEIESRENQQNQSRFKLLTQNVLRPAFLVLIISINLITAVLLWQNSDYQTENRQEYLAAFAEEYSLNQNDYNKLLNDFQE